MGTDLRSDRTRRIRELNDAFRRSFVGGRVLVTSGVSELPVETNAAVLSGSDAAASDRSCRSS